MFLARRASRQATATAARYVSSSSASPGGAGALRGGMVRTATVAVFNMRQVAAVPMGLRHLSAGGGKKGGDDDDGAGKKMKIDPQQMAFLREAMKQGRVQVVDDEPAPMSDDEKNLPQFDGEAPERVKHGMAYAAQFIQSGKVKEAVSAIEGTVQRAYREGNREDDILLEILAQAHLMAATFRQNLSQYEPALLHFEGAINNCPRATTSNPTFYYGAGACYAVMGKLPDALSSFSLAAAVLEENKEAAKGMTWLQVVLPLNMGQTLLRMGKPGEALTMLGKALKAGLKEGEDKANETRTAVFYFSALANSAMGRHEEACRVWGDFEGFVKIAVDKQIQLEVDWESRWLMHYSRSLLLAASLKQQEGGDGRAKAHEYLEKAEGMTKELTSARPGVWRGWWLRADCMRAMGDAQEAVECYTKLLGCSDAPSYVPDVFLQSGNCLMALGKHKEAAVMFQTEIDFMMKGSSQPHPRASLALAEALCAQAEGKGGNGEVLLAEAEKLLAGVLADTKGKTTVETMVTRSQAKVVEVLILAQRRDTDAEKRVELLEAALKLDPSNTQAAAMLEEAHK